MQAIAEQAGAIQELRGQTEAKLNELHKEIQGIKVMPEFWQQAWVTTILKYW